LTWFKNSSKEERANLRKELNHADVGYLTSFLLLMLNSEEEFKIWLDASADAEFDYFKRENE